MSTSKQLHNNDKQFLVQHLLKTVAPLKLYEPINFIVFISLYSPVIIALTMVAMSFTTKSWKGLIFLAFLIASCSFRSYLYFLFDKRPYVQDTSRFICDSVQYTGPGFSNNLFSPFVFAFTIMYVSLPMFYNKQINIYVFAGLFGYFLLDTFIKYGNKCISDYQELFINVLGGAFLSGVLVILMNMGGSGKHLFYNDENDTDDTGTGTKCAMSDSRQTFKCRVYKNGELISG